MGMATPNPFARVAFSLTTITKMFAATGIEYFSFFILRTFEKFYIVENL